MATIERTLERFQANTLDSAAGDIALEFKRVGFGYTSAIPVLDEFSWQVQQGEFWAILGPSGSGKTTLLHLLAGIRQAAQGQVCLEGKPIDKPSTHIGLMLQDYGLLPWFRVERNVSLGLKMRGVAKDEREARVTTWLERLGLETLRKQFPSQLSGGQRQRVALARVLALEPRMLLLDEPLSAVDELARERLQNRLYDLSRSSGATTLMVTHSIEEAVLLAEHILLITDYGPIRTVERLTTPFESKPVRSDPDFIAFCQHIRERIGLT